MHLQNPLHLSLFFLAFSTITSCTDLSIPSPFFLASSTHLSPRSPPKPFNPPTCSPPSSEGTTYHITCSSLFPSEFHCTTPDRDCVLHTDPLHSRKRKKPSYQTPITTSISRTLPLRCERNCFCDSCGHVNCGNDKKRYNAAEREPRFVTRLTNVCRPICACESREEEGEEVSFKSVSSSPPLRGSESPPHRGIQGPSRGGRSRRPRRAGFLSPEPEGLRSPSRGG